jgi:hypothetical protein
MILVAGPYRSGTNDDPALIQANVAAMTDVATTSVQNGALSDVARMVCVSFNRACRIQEDRRRHLR